MTRTCLRILALTAMLAGGVPTTFAGNYGVSPLDVQFSAQQKSAVLTVTNEDRKDISLRLRAMRWTQDEQGRDRYEEAADLVFFPKRLDLKPGDRRIVRVGVQGLPAQGERAWRLYLEELAPAQAPGAGQTRLSVLVNIGVPVFATAAEARPALKAERANASGEGRVDVVVSNAGTSRVRLSRIVAADGTEVTESLPSRYVFPGITKTLSFTLPKALCRGGAATLRLESDGQGAEVGVTLPGTCQG